MKKMNLILAAALCAGSVTLAGYEKYSEAEKAGWKAYSAKDYKTMQKAFAEAKELASGSTQEWSAAYGESRAYREMQKWDDALKVIDNYLKTGPAKSTKAEALFVKGLILSSKNDYKAARDNFEASIKYPELSAGSRDQAHSHLSGIYRNQLKQKDLAIKYYKLLTQSKEKMYRFNGFYMQGVYAIEGKQYAEAVKYLADAEKNIGNEYNKLCCYYQQGEALLGAKKTDEALAKFKEVQKMDPKGWRGRNAASYIKKNSK